MTYRVEFVEFVEKTGATTRRALFRVFDNEEWMFSVVAGLTYSLLSELRVSEDVVSDAQLQYAQRLINARLKTDPAWVERSRGDNEVVFDLDSYNVDKAEFLRIIRQ
jgi:hypothetical protein